MKEQTRYRVTGAIFLLAIAIMVLPMVFDGEGVRVTQLPELTEPLPPMPTATELDALQIPESEVAAHRAEQELTAGLLDAEGFDTTSGTRLGDPTLHEVDLEPAQQENPPPDAIALRDEDAADTAATSPSTIPAAAPLTAPSTAPAPAVSVAAAPDVSTVPARTAPAVAPPSPKGATPALAKRSIWAVQLASFASPINATALRDKLLEDGFEAWTSTARKDSVVRTRVAIGPLLDRGDAQRMRDLVSGRYSVSAIIVHMEP